jgi:alkanesulfonate monooxygenase SsuD/methylene tetrahydromethanopterin reductase-like flavin-dependent oxidoreductase (luciferase family)
MSVVKIGVCLPMSGDRIIHGAPSLIAVAQRAEDLGLDTVSVSETHGAGITGQLVLS